MPLTVPDESLASVQEAKCYHAKRTTGAVWATLTPERQEQLLREACDYLRTEFGAQWPAGQTFGVLADGVTVAIGARDACAILALIANDGPLDPEVTAQEIESTVGPLTSKFAQATNGGRRNFPQVVRLMAPYLAASTANPFSVKLVRA